MPIEVTLPCGSSEHRLRVRVADGTLELLDHEADREQIVAALGGEVSACVELAAAWTASASVLADARKLLAIVAPDLLSDGAVADLDKQIAGRASSSFRYMVLQHTPDAGFEAVSDLEAMERDAHVYLVLRAMPGDLTIPLVRRHVAVVADDWHRTGKRPDAAGAVEELARRCGDGRPVRLVDPGGASEDGSPTGSSVPITFDEVMARVQSIR